MAHRGLSGCFLEDLKVGCLSPLLERVKADDTLHLAIRTNGINIYYRGGSLLKVSGPPGTKRDAARIYGATFDQNYFAGARPSAHERCPPTLQHREHAHAWVDAFSELKQEMDFWFAKKRRIERGYQQLIARANNTGHAGRATDYFIIDIEYTEQKERFDMIAARWESNASSRKAGTARLALIELKYGDKTITGKGGLVKHINGMSQLVSRPQRLAQIKAESLAMFEQQLSLGLIRAPKPLGAFTDEKPEYILFLVDHDPDSSILRNVMDSIAGLPAPVGYELELCTATFMGFGLFKEGIHSFDDFRENMASKICARKR